MVVIKYLVPAAALASSVFAQCSVKGTMTVTNTADLAKITGCSTFTGSIAIDKKAAGDIAIDGPSHIKGDVIAYNTNGISSLSGSNIQTIDGMLNVTQASELSSISFPALSTVDTLWLQALGTGFQTFMTSIKSINTLAIQTTFLTSLEGLGITAADTVIIANNADISQLSLPFTEISSLQVRGNNNGLTLSLAKLKKAKDISINQCSMVTFPSLTETTGLLAVDDNTITSVSFPKLTSAAGLDVSSNPTLKHLSAPKLKTIGGTFNVAYNTDLTGTISFPSLQTVGGGPNITGSFTGLSIPKLKQVRGAATIKSSKNIDNTVCKHFNNLGSSVFQGTLTCTGKVAQKHVSHPGGGHHGGGGSSNGGSPSGGGGNGGNGGNAAGHHEASLYATLSVFGIVAASFAWLL